MQFHVYILTDKFCIASIFVFQDENKPKIHIFKIAEDDLRYRYMEVWESFSTKHSWTALLCSWLVFLEI